MKAYMLYDGRDFIEEKGNSLDIKSLIADLELETLFEAMAKDDTYIYQTVKQIIFLPLVDVEEIRYRQNIMIDCIKNQATIREMYAIAAEAMARRRNESWGLNSRHLASVLSSSVSLLQIFAEMLTKLRAVVDKSAGLVISKGWSRLIETIQTELSDDYLAEIKAHLRELKFYDGMLISAELGDINQGIYFTLRRQSGIKRREQS